MYLFSCDLYIFVVVVFSHGAAQDNNALCMYYNYLICRLCNNTGTCQSLLISNNIHVV